jgi:DNA mismatch endonuclease (patch repair protein)
MRRRRRSRLSRQRTENTLPERRLRRALIALDQTYSTNTPILGARPDIVFAAAKVAVFVDGCFWHGCPTHFQVPQTNPLFWDMKIRRNRARDVRLKAKLEAAGWVVLRFWEHAITHSAAEVARLVVEAVRERGSSTDPVPHKAQPAARSGTGTRRTAPTTQMGPVAPKGRKVAASTSDVPNVRRKRAAPKPKKSGAAG